eukprot:14339594-Alexandrium_andersonii.AAC.1
MEEAGPATARHCCCCWPHSSRPGPARPPGRAAWGRPCPPGAWPGPPPTAARCGRGACTWQAAPP